MIIRDQGIVVGMIDDKSMKLSDSSSERLESLVADWKKKGIYVSHPGDAEAEGLASSDGEMHIKYIPENVAFFRNELWIAGFEVQTA